MAAEPGVVRCQLQEARDAMFAVNSLLGQIHAHLDVLCSPKGAAEDQHLSAAADTAVEQQLPQPAAKLLAGITAMHAVQPRQQPQQTRNHSSSAHWSDCISQPLERGSEQHPLNQEQIQCDISEHLQTQEQQEQQQDSPQGSEISLSSSFPGPCSSSPSFVAAAAAAEAATAAAVSMQQQLAARLVAAAAAAAGNFASACSKTQQHCDHSPNSALAATLPATARGSASEVPQAAPCSQLALLGADDCVPGVQQPPPLHTAAPAAAAAAGVTEELPDETSHHDQTAVHMQAAAPVGQIVSWLACSKPAAAAAAAAADSGQQDADTAEPEDQEQLQHCDKVEEQLSCQVQLRLGSDALAGDCSISVSQSTALPGCVEASRGSSSCSSSPDTPQHQPTQQPLRQRWQLQDSRPACADLQKELEPQQVVQHLQLQRRQEEHQRQQQLLQRQHWQEDTQRQWQQLQQQWRQLVQRQQWPLDQAPEQQSDPSSLPGGCTATAAYVAPPSAPQQQQQLQEQVMPAVHQESSTKQVEETQQVQQLRRRVHLSGTTLQCMSADDVGYVQQAQLQQQAHPVANPREHQLPAGQQVDDSNVGYASFGDAKYTQQSQQELEQLLAEQQVQQHQQVHDTQQGDQKALRHRYESEDAQQAELQPEQVQEPQHLLDEQQEAQWSLYTAPWAVDSQLASQLSGQLSSRQDSCASQVLEVLEAAGDWQQQQQQQQREDAVGGVEGSVETAHAAAAAAAIAPAQLVSDAAEVVRAADCSVSTDAAAAPADSNSQQQQGEAAYSPEAAAVASHVCVRAVDCPGQISRADSCDTWITSSCNSCGDVTQQQQQQQQQQEEVPQQLLQGHVVPAGANHTQVQQQEQQQATLRQEVSEQLPMPDIFKQLSNTMAELCCSLSSPSPQAATTAEDVSAAPTLPAPAPPATEDAVAMLAGAEAAALPAAAAAAAAQPDGMPDTAAAADKAGTPPAAAHTMANAAIPQAATAAAAAAAASATSRFKGAWGSAGGPDPCFQGSASCDGAQQQSAAQGCPAAAAAGPAAPSRMTVAARQLLQRRAPRLSVEWPCRSSEGSSVTVGGAAAAVDGSAGSAAVCSEPGSSKLLLDLAAAATAAPATGAGADEKLCDSVYLTVSSTGLQHDTESQQQQQQQQCRQQKQQPAEQSQALSLQAMSSQKQQPHQKAHQACAGHNSAHLSGSSIAGVTSDSSVPGSSCAGDNSSKTNCSRSLAKAAAAVLRTPSKQQQQQQQLLQPPVPCASPQLAARAAAVALAQDAAGRIAVCEGALAAGLSDTARAAAAACDAAGVQAGLQARWREGLGSQQQGRLSSRSNRSSMPELRLPVQPELHQPVLVCQTLTAAAAAVAGSRGGAAGSGGSAKLQQLKALQDRRLQQRQQQQQQQQHACSSAVAWQGQSPTRLAVHRSTEQAADTAVATRPCGCSRRAASCSILMRSAEAAVGSSRWSQPRQRQQPQQQQQQQQQQRRAQDRQVLHSRQDRRTERIVHSAEKQTPTRQHSRGFSTSSAGTPSGSSSSSSSSSGLSGLDVGGAARWHSVGSSSNCAGRVSSSVAFGRGWSAGHQGPHMHTLQQQQMRVQRMVPKSAQQRRSSGKQVSQYESYESSSSDDDDEVGSVTSSVAESIRASWAQGKWRNSPGLLERARKLGLSQRHTQQQQQQQQQQGKAACSRRLLLVPFSPSRTSTGGGLARVDSSGSSSDGGGTR